MSTARYAYVTGGELDAAQSDRVVAGPVGNRGGRVSDALSGVAVVSGQRWPNANRA